MDFTCNVAEKEKALYSMHIHYLPEVLPDLLCQGIYLIAVALIFTAVLYLFIRGGRR